MKRSVVAEAQGAWRDAAIACRSDGGRCGGRADGRMEMRVGAPETAAS